MLKTIKQSLLYVTAFSSFFLLAGTVNANNYHPINKTTYGFLTNNATIHQEPNVNSKTIKTVYLKNFEGHDINASLPDVSHQEINNMYKITYEGQTGYIDSDNFIVQHNFHNNYGFSHYNRQSANQLVNDAKNKNYQVPNFRNMRIKDIPSAKNQQKLGKYYYGIRDSNQLDIINNWPVQNQNGTMADYDEYHLMIAVTRDNNGFSLGAAPAHLYLFYQKDKDSNQGVKSWHNAGPLFDSKTEGANNINDQYLKKQTDELSGSAYQLNSNDSNIRLFYTDYSGNPKLGGGGNNNQVLSTANINLSINNNGIKINHDKNSDHKSIYTGQGVTYQSENQFFSEWPDNWEFDNMSMQDPHYVEDHGNKYLIFGANTGTSDGYQGRDNLYNQNFLGNDKYYSQSQQDELFNDKNKKTGMQAQFANGAIGMIKLNNNFSLSSIKKPLIGFNSVVDQINRPNLVKTNNKYYLFADINGQNITSKERNYHQNYMIGFVADNLTGPYHLLNNNGLVLASTNNNPNSRKYSYNYYVYPDQNNANRLIVTSSMTNPGAPDNNGGHGTMGPTFKLDINGNTTQVQDGSSLPQGVSNNE